MTNPSPVEKQLLHMELSKGINEKDRAETADSATCLTQVQNLYQDQTGSYVKRTGNVRMADLPSSGIPSKLLRLRGGLGIVSSAGLFYQNQESGLAPEVKRRGELAKFSLKADAVGRTTYAYPNCSASTSCTGFHAIIAEGWLELYDREAEAVVARYNLMQVCGQVQLLATHSAVAVFVADRYLHVHVPHIVAAADDKLYSFIIDTAVELPDPDTYTATKITTTLAAGGSIHCVDIDAGPDASYALYCDLDVPGPSYVIKLTNSLVGVVGTMPADTRAISYSTYDGDNYLWYITAADIGYYETTTMTSVANNAIAFTSMEVYAGTPYDYSVGLLSDSSGITWIAYEYSYTVDTGKTVTSIKLWKTPSAQSLVPAQYATIDGWRMGSHPVEYSAGGVSGHAMHLVKEIGIEISPTESTDPTLAPHVIASIDATDMSTLGYTGTTPHTSFTILASLEVNVGMLNLANTSTFGMGRTIKMLPSNGSVGAGGATLTKFTTLVPVKVTARGGGYLVVEARTDKQDDRSCAVFGGSNYISGGTHMAFCGGRVPNEVGYVDVPILNITKNAASGGVLAAGNYQYVAVFKHKDDYGNVTYSRCSEIESVTVVAGDTMNCTVVPPNITNKDDGVLVSPTTINLPITTIEIYRTLLGGTQFYYAVEAFLQSGAASRIALGVSGIVDTEAIIAADTALFRQPGTPNSAVDRYPPQGSNILIQHKDRLFTTDPLGARVCYSSFFVDGETAWYNPAFSFFVHGGSGPITAIASMDGRLFVFKRDSVFVVDGDGPGEAGVTGNEYSPPQRLATEHGCVDHRTVAVSSEGIVYRSPRGIELLTRSLQVKFIGERVQSTAAAYPESHGSTMDTGGKYSVLVSTVGGLATRELVYDFPADCWTVNLHDSYGAYDVCMANLKTYGDTMCYASSSGYIMRRALASEATYYDYNSTYTPWVIETGWMKTGQQVRARYSKLLALLKKNTGCNYKMTLSVAFNYIESYTQVATWEPGVLNALTVGELELQIAKQEVLAVRFKMEDGLPTSRSISSSTDATPIVVTTSAAHGFVAGDTIVVAGHATNVAANGTWVIGTVPTSTSFSLLTSVGSGAGAGTGGTAIYPLGSGQGPDVLGITLEVAPKMGAPKGPAAHAG